MVIIPSAKTQGVGIGISTYSINISGSILDYYVTTIRLINPSPYEVSAKIYFDCKDCTKDINLFGRKIAEKTVDYKSFFTLDKYDITIPPMTFGNNAPPVKITFSPKFIVKNYLKIYTPRGHKFFYQTCKQKL